MQSVANASHKSFWTQKVGWGSLLILLVGGVGAWWIWQRQDSSGLILSGQYHSVDVYQGQLYIATRQPDNQTLVRSVTALGSPLRAEQGFPPQMFPGSLQCDEEGITFLSAYLGSDPDPAHQEGHRDNAPSEYYIYQAGNAAARFFRPRTQRDSSMFYWPGMGAPGRSVLWQLPWKAEKPVPMPLGLPNARPMRILKTPHYFYWVNMHPIEACQRRPSDGGRINLGLRGHNELVVVPRTGGQARVVANDLLPFSGTFSLSLTTLGDDLYWLEQAPVRWTPQGFVPATGTQIRCYRPSEGKVRLLATLPEASLRSPMVAFQDRLYILGSAHTRVDAQGNLSPPTAPEAFTVSLDGKSTRRLSATELSHDGIVQLLQRHQDRLLGVVMGAKEGFCFEIQPGEMPRFRRLTEPRLPFNAQAVGFDGHYLYWTQVEEQENWTKWSGTGLDKQWRTRIRRSPLTF